MLVGVHVALLQRPVQNGVIAVLVAGVGDVVDSLFHLILERDVAGLHRRAPGQAPHIPRQVGGRDAEHLCAGGQQSLEGVGPGPLALAVGALDGRLSGLDKVGHDLHFRAGHVVALHDGQRVLYKGDLPQGVHVAADVALHDGVPGFLPGGLLVTGDAGERSPEALPVFFIFVIVAHGVDKALGQSVDHVRHHQGRGRPAHRLDGLAALLAVLFVAHLVIGPHQQVEAHYRLAHEAGRLLHHRVAGAHDVGPLEHAVYHLGLVDDLREQLCRLSVERLAALGEALVFPRRGPLAGVPQLTPGHGVRRARRGGKGVVQLPHVRPVVEQRLGHLVGAGDVEAARILPHGDGGVLQGFLPSAAPRNASCKAPRHVLGVQYRRRPEERRGLLDDHADVRAHGCALEAADGLSGDVPHGAVAGGVDAVLDVLHQVVPVFLTAGAAHAVQQSLDGLAGWVALLVPELVVEQAVDVLHRAEPGGIVRHVGGVVGKGGEDARQVQGVARVGHRGLCHADVLNGAGVVPALFDVAVQALLGRFDGPVVALGELLVTVGFHAGLVAVVGQHATGQSLQAVRDLHLFRRQRPGDVHQVALRQADAVRAAPDLRGFDLWLDHAALEQVVVGLLALHQLVQLHHLGSGKGQLLASLRGEGMRGRLQLLHRLGVHDLADLLGHMVHHELLLVLRVPQHPVDRLARLSVMGEEGVRGLQVNEGVVAGQAVLGPAAAGPDGDSLRPVRRPGVLGLGQDFPRRVHAVLHGLDHLPHGLKLRHAHVGQLDVLHGDDRIKAALDAVGVAAQQGGVDDHIPALGHDLGVLLLEGAERLGPLGGGAAAVLHPLAVLVEGVLALLVDALQHSGHASAHGLRDVVLVAGAEELLGQGTCMAGDFGPQLTGRPALPTRRVLGRIAVFQGAHLPLAGLPLLGDGVLYPLPVLLPQLRQAGGVLLPHLLDLLPALGLGVLQLQCLPVRKGLSRLGQVEEGLHDLVRRAGHGLVHVAGEGVVLVDLADAVQHFHDVEELVRRMGLLLLAEKLRPAGGKLLVHLVDVGVALAAQVQPSELPLAEIAVVCDVPVVLLAVDDLGRPQVVPQVAVRIVHIAVHGHRVAHQGFRDVLRPAASLGVGQLVLAVVAAGDVVIEALEAPLDVLHRDVGPVVLDKLFRGGGHGLFVRGHALGPPGLALPVVPALLELPVSALNGDIVLHLLPQQSVFLLQGGNTLAFRPGLEGEAGVVHAVDLGKAVRVVSGLVFQHPHTGLLQTVPQLLAAVIGDDGGQHFVEADSPLGLGLKVAGGHFRRRLVDGLDVLGRLAADFVPLLGEGPHDSVHRPFALGRFHQDAADDVALDEGIVGMSLVSLLDLCDDAANLVINGLELCFILGPLVHAQPPAVRLDLLDAAVFRRRHGLQGLGACAPGVAAALLLALLHRLDDVLQGVGIVELREAAEIAGGGVGVLAIVDARLAQQAVQLPGNPLLNGVVIHGAAQRVRGSHPVDFALGRAAVLVHIPCVVNDVLQGEDGNAVHGIVDAGLPSFVDLRVGPMPLDGHSAEHGFALFPVVVPENVADDLGILAQGVLHALAGLQVGLDFSQRVHAQAVNHLLQGVVTELVPHLVHLHRLQALALVCQIGRPHRVRGGQLLRQLCRAPGAGVVDAHRAQGGAVPEDAPGHGDIPGKPVQLVLHLGCLFAVHGVIYSRSCRRPGVAAVHLVGAE